MLFGEILVVLIWESLPDRFPVIIDTYQIMPNHFHGIIIINQSVGAPLVGARSHKRAGTSPAPTLGDIIGAFKSLSTNAWGNGKIWQRNFWEHVIRNETELNKISWYIINNPGMWDGDKNNPAIN